MYHTKITHHSQTKHSTQSFTTIKDTLHTMNTMQEKKEKSIAIPLTGLGPIGL
jgi:hypothetical protein